MKLHKRKRQNKESWEQLQENVKLTDQQYFYVFGIYGIHHTPKSTKRYNSVFNIFREERK